MKPCQFIKILSTKVNGDYRALHIFWEDHACGFFFVCWHVEVSDIYTYRQTSNISCSKYQNLNGSHLVVVFAQSIDAGCEVKNEDVWAVPTFTSEWSTILLPTKVATFVRCLRVYTPNYIAYMNEECDWLDHIFYSKSR